jgi:predicted N-acetyltransferase YhbS
MPPDLTIDPRGEHRDLIPVTVDWHMREFDLSGDRDVWLRARTEEARLRGVPCAWVAFEGDTPVGCVSLVARNMETRPELTPWLAALFVLPEYRGRGVGDALVRRCQAEAEMSGFERLYLYTRGAQDFYRRLGWFPIEEDSYEGEPVTIMTRKLG